jgi:hypothetical protein
VQVIFEIAIVREAGFGRQVESGFDTRIFDL